MSNENYNSGNQSIGHEQAEQLKQQAEQKIDQAIDQFAQKIPGGTQFSQQAKDAAGNALDALEQQAEAQAGNLLGNAGNAIGGLFGHHNEQNKQ
jgi:hypothetical protein